MDALAECPDIVAGTGKTCIVSNLSYRKRRMFQQFHASADPVFYNIVKDRTVEGPAEKAAAGFPAKMNCPGKLFQQNAAAISGSALLPPVSPGRQMVLRRGDPHGGPGVSTSG